jgi:hypothetical protein
MYRMDNTIYILVIFHFTFCALIIACSLVYLLPLLFIRRFHTPINIVTANVCVAIFTCAVYWIVIRLLATFFPNLYNANPGVCPFQTYTQAVVLCQVVYALCLVCIRRLCIIIYSQKTLLKTKKWVFICVGVQWIFSAIIALPTFFVLEKVNKQQFLRMRKIHCLIFLS